MDVKVTSHLGDLEADLDRIAVESMRDMEKVVREGIKVGNTLARDMAHRSAGKHGKLYPRSFSWEIKLLGGPGLIAGEYGPDSAKPQGGMSFEWGSRNQKPHLDLNRSADIMGPALQGEVRRKIDGWFW